MRYKLTDSLGTQDARFCNENFAAGIELNATKLAKGEVIDIPDKAAEWLTSRYQALLEPVSGKVRGEAKQPEITAPLKQ